MHKIIMRVFQAKGPLKVSREHNANTKKEKNRVYPIAVRILDRIES